MTIKNIAVCGQRELAIKCTEILLSKKPNLAFVVPNASDSGKDTWQPSFKKWAISKNLNIVEPIIELMNKAIQEKNIDMIFSIYFDKIYKKDTLKLLPYGIINTHFSPLPEYRGVAPITMAILSGEENHGVSLHYVDEGIDRGDIISRRHFEIKDLNANEVFDKAIENCILLFREQIDLILCGKHKRIKQDNTKASYYPMKTIDWSKDNTIENNRKFFNKDTRSLYNWFRAFIFPPQQYPVLNIDNISYEVLKAEPIYQANLFEKPGTVKELNNNGTDTDSAVISTHDGYIKLNVKKKEAL